MSSSGSSGASAVPSSSASAGAVRPFTAPVRSVPSSFRGIRPLSTGVAAAAGAVATTLIAWGTTNGEWVFNGDAWPHPTVRAIGATIPQPWDRVAIIVGGLLLLALWWLLRPADDRPGVRRPGLVLAAWAVPLLLAPPVLSGDAVLYADAGYLMGHGKDPYLDGLTSAGGPFAPYVDPLWAGSGVAYPPLTLLIDRWLVSLTGAHPYWSVVAMRLPAVVGVALLVASLAGIARARGRSADESLWWGALNPLLVLHFLGGAHNDALMAGLSLAAIWLVLRRRSAWVTFLVAPVVVGLAMALKQQAGLTVLAVAGVGVLDELRRRPVARRLWLLGTRTAAVTAVAVATFVGVSVASGLGFGWTRWLTLMGAAGTVAPFGMIAQYGGLYLQSVGADPEPFQRAVGLVSTVVLLLVLAWIVVRWSDRPIQAVAWSSLAVAVLGQALHPWYLPWSLAFVGLDRLSPRQRTLLLWGISALVVWNTVQSTVFYKVRL